MFFEIAEGDGIAAEATGQRLGVVERAIGDDQAAHLGFGQVTGGQLNGLAGANEQDAGLGKVGEHGFGEAHRGEGDGYRARTDARIRADPLGDRKRVLEKALQRRIEGAGMPGDRIGILDLAENLRLAENHRFEPGGHAEQVPHGIGIVVAVEEFLDVRAMQLPMSMQPVEWRGLGAGFDIAVQLGAVAGREDGRFTHAGLRNQLDQGASGGVRRKRRPLAQGDRCANVIESESDQGHACNNPVQGRSMRRVEGKCAGDCVELRSGANGLALNEMCCRAV